MTAPTDYAGLIRQLLAGGVEFILVGGLAANVHGSARATYDVDVVYRRSEENLSCLERTLAPLRPYLRGAPPGGGAYEDLLPSTESIALFGMTCRCATLDALIRMKRAAGRPKDLEAIAELEALRDERAGDT